LGGREFAARARESEGASEMRARGGEKIEHLPDEHGRRAGILKNWGKSKSNARQGTASCDEKGKGDEGPEERKKDGLKRRKRGKDGRP